MPTASGKTIARLDIGYDQPGESGGYRGYIDDINIGSSFFSMRVQ